MVRILVADQDPATVALVQRELEREGHEVVAAFDEAEALRRVRTEWLEFVILDGTTIGLEPLRALRAVPWTQDVPVVVLSACPEVGAISEAYREGADMALTKPFNPHELVTFRRPD